MGANTGNNILVSRRFAPCYMLADDPIYIALILAYCHTREKAQDGKAGHDQHMESIRQIKRYLAKHDHKIQHR